MRYWFQSGYLFDSHSRTESLGGGPRRPYVWPFVYPYYQALPEINTIVTKQICKGKMAVGVE